MRIGISNQPRLVTFETLLPQAFSFFNRDVTWRIRPTQLYCDFIDNCITLRNHLVRFRKQILCLRVLCF